LIAVQKNNMVNHAVGYTSRQSFGIGVISGQYTISYE